MNQQDCPLNATFYQNPLQYMQNHVRNLNNQIFLSEYQINTLYALLLIGRNSPWDSIKGNSGKAKDEIDLVLNHKVQEVKIILQHLSNTYEDKSKKSAISQIEKLMDILKSKRKSIFIQKDKSCVSFQKFKALARMAQQLEQEERERKRLTEETIQSESKLLEKNNQQTTIEETSQIQGQHEIIHEAEGTPRENQQIEVLPLLKKQEQGDKSQERQKKIINEKETDYNCDSHTKEINNPIEQVNETQKKEKYDTEEYEFREDKKNQKMEQKKSLDYDSGKQVFSIFYGLSNMSNLTAMALTNVVEYNSAQRFLKFKMSDSYFMTIKSEDPFHFDTISQFSKIPPEMFTNHIFPYLTASELFMCRSVCKEWLDYVKQSWHSTFKREMFIQLLACEFCKDIEFFYKTIQLRNPFFQKISLLIHALIQIINWQVVSNLIQTNTLSLQLKKLLIILLRLTGEDIPLSNLNALNDAFYDQHKEKLINIKAKVALFFSTLSGSDLSIDDLRRIKTQFLDDHFMRVEQVSGSDDKAPLLINLLVKQITLQQILRNHIYLAQQYLLNTKKRLDNISKKMVYQKGYLEGIYKILLLKSTEPFSAEGDSNQLPNFNDMIQSIFTNRNCEKPDFVLRGKTSSTQIYLDNQTKLDIILSTVYNINRDKQRGGVDEEVQSTMKKEDQIEKEDLSEEERKIKQEKNEIVTLIDMKIEVSQKKEEQVQNGEEGEKKEKETR